MKHVYEVLGYLICPLDECILGPEALQIDAILLLEIRAVGDTEEGNPACGGSLGSAHRGPCLSHRMG